MSGMELLTTQAVIWAEQKQGVVLMSMKKIVIATGVLIMMLMGIAETATAFECHSDGKGGMQCTSQQLDWLDGK